MRYIECHYDKCDKKFEFNIKVSNRKYCNKECCDKQQKENYNKNKKIINNNFQDKECAYKKCNKIFKPNTANQRFCSRECSDSHHGLLKKKKITKTFTCEWCNEKFERTGYEANLKYVKFCSTKCAQKAAQAKKKTGATDHSSKISAKRRTGYHNEQSVKLELPDYRFGSGAYCTYCGESLLHTPTHVEHCIPNSFFLQLGMKTSNARGLTTYSCATCNNKLGDKIFNTFRQRREYLTNYYQTITDRFFNEENTWTEEELDEHEVDYGLRKLIEQKIHNRYVLLDKLNWPLSPEYGQIISDVTFDIKYTDIFNDTQLYFMKRYFEVEDERY